METSRHSTESSSKEINLSCKLGLERNTEREGNLSNIPKGNFVSATVKLEK